MPATEPTDQGLSDTQATAADTLLIERPIPPCSLVIFGATGDLTHRKLIPALFSLEAQGLLPDHFKIVGFARREYSDHSFRDELQASVEEFAPDLWKESHKDWARFARRVVFHRSDFDNAQGFSWLKEAPRQVRCQRKYGGQPAVLSRHTAQHLHHRYRAAWQGGASQKRRCPGQQGLHAHYRREAVRLGFKQRPRLER